MATDPVQGTPEPVWVWGLPLAPVTFGQAVDHIADRSVGRLVHAHQPVAKLRWSVGAVVGMAGVGEVPEEVAGLMALAK